VKFQPTAAYRKAKADLMAAFELFESDDYQSRMALSEGEAQLEEAVKLFLWVIS